MSDASREQKPRPIVVFRHLTAANFCVALALRCAGRRIVYIEALGLLRSSSWKRKLAACGIEWADCPHLDHLDYGQNIRTTATYAERLMDRFFPDSEIQHLANLAPEFGDNVPAFRALVFDCIVQAIAPFSYAYGLAEYFRDQGIRADVYQKTRASDAYLESDDLIEIRNFYFLHPRHWFNLAVRMVISSRALGHLFRHAGSFFPEPGKNTGKMEQTDRAQGKVLYFPHLGVAYSNLFLKDQYYAHLPSSPFFKSNILHVEFGWMIPESDRTSIERDYDELGERPVLLDPPAPWRPINLLRVCGAFAATISGPGRAAKVFALTTAFRQFVDYHTMLAPFRSARLALVGYDVLFPVGAALALRAIGVHVAATQERFIQPFYGTFALAFDTYFVHGEFTKRQITADRTMNIKNIVVTGDVRKDDITKHKAEAEIERRNKFGGFDHVCLVLDYHTRPDYTENSYYFWLSGSANRLFYDHVIRLAKRYPRCVFILRGKLTNWMEIPEMGSTLTKMRGLNNLFIDGKQKEYGRAHLLAAMADIIIARHTSLCDQCLAVGKPVLIDEALPNGGRLVSAMHDYPGYPVIIRDGDELEARFHSCLYNDHFIPECKLAEMRSSYYGDDGTGRSARDRLAEALNNLLREPTPQREPSAKSSN